MPGIYCLNSFDLSPRLLVTLNVKSQTCLEQMPVNGEETRPLICRELQCNFPCTKISGPQMLADLEAMEITIPVTTASSKTASRGTGGRRGSCTKYG
ncbi:hypothetical protein SUGI_0096070 [Cryptomeria japonica]|nr:hypothetical protein SUGI_0096070 [Cryptomeria japonica]